MEQEKYNNLSKLVEKLKKSEDPKRKYEYILWLGKKLKEPDSEILVEENKVKGCVSEVFVKANIKGGKLFWEGYSDALITKGLLAFLITGLNELTPNEVVEIDKKFIEDTGLKASLTPSRPLTKDSEGILSPNNSSPLSHLQISMIFVPCLSVDKNLIRLGYGGGYFDN